MHQEWYQKFVSEENMDRELLFELLTAANYLGIHPLLQLINLKITFVLNGKTEAQVSSTTCVPALGSASFFPTQKFFQCLGPWVSWAASGGGGSSGGGGCGVRCDVNLRQNLYRVLKKQFSFCTFLHAGIPEIRTRVIRVAPCDLSIDCDMS